MTHPFSSSQLRAARALINWSRADLAQHTGVSEPTLHRLENNQGEAEAKTQQKIRTILEENGVEFTENSGVRLKPQGVEVLVGHEGLQQFFDSVYEHACKHGGTIVQYGLEEHFLSNLGGDYAKLHRTRMKQLVEERKDVKVLALVCEGDTNFVCSDYNEYRWVPKQFFSPVLFYIYGECTAILNFHTLPAPTIILLKFPTVTNACRKQFEIFWKMSKKPGASVSIESKAKKK